MVYTFEKLCLWMYRKVKFFLFSRVCLLEMLTGKIVLTRLASKRFTVREYLEGLHNLLSPETCLSSST